MPVNCDGEIVKWKYYAHTRGSMMVGIWDRLGGKTFRLVGKNKITVSPTEVGVSVCKR